MTSFVAPHCGAAGIDGLVSVTNCGKFLAIVDEYISRPSVKIIDHVMP